MKYLITGGCGFIGVNFADRLLSRGDDVIVLDNLSRRGTVSNLLYLNSRYENVEFAHADIRVDFDKLKLLMEDVDVVYHFAGQVAVTSSYKNPREDFEINALGTLNVLEAIRQSEKKPLLINASTNKVYGGLERVEVKKNKTRYAEKDYEYGITEDQQLDFHSPYGCSKGVADQYVRDYARMYDLKTVSMRQSCIYGTRQFGIEDQGWVAWFTIAAHLNQPITIYGDGFQVRDVLFVDDLFEAWDLATKKIETTSGEVYNLGGGPDYSLSLMELLNFLEENLAKKIMYTHSETRPGDQLVYISDIRKAEKHLGWKPKISPKKGVELLTSWIAQNGDMIQEQLGMDKS